VGPARQAFLALAVPLEEVVEVDLVKGMVEEEEVGEVSLR